MLVDGQRLRRFVQRVCFEIQIDVILDNAAYSKLRLDVISHPC